MAISAVRSGLYEKEIFALLSSYILCVCTVTIVRIRSRYTVTFFFFYSNFIIAIVVARLL